MRASRLGRRRAFYDWWESSSQFYFRENFGDVGEEIRKNFAEILFPPHAEPTLPELALPVSFIHLRLLAGEELGFVLRRVENLAALFGARAAKPTIGLLYLVLTALTSRHAKLSSMARAQTAFFSLLLRRVAHMLDDGVDEDTIREELSGVWEIRTEAIANATLASGRGLWRRLGDAHLGLTPLPMNLDVWLESNGLTNRVARTRKTYGRVEESHHLFEVFNRLAAIEGLGIAMASAECAGREAAWEDVRIGLVRSLEGAMNGITPWESAVLRAGSPRLLSLLSWANKLQLLHEGETPTAYPGREKLPDWLEDFLSDKNENENDGILSSGRFIVGGETYIVVGVDAAASPELLSVALGAPECVEANVLGLGVRFGDGTHRSFPFRLDEGKDLLAAIYLAEQDDVRLDFIVRGEDRNWRFGASSYLVMTQEHRKMWVACLLSYLSKKFQGDEGRIQLEILRGMK